MHKTLSIRLLLLQNDKHLDLLMFDCSFMDPSDLIGKYEIVSYTQGN
jgi:hypothetical protein